MHSPLFYCAYRGKWPSHGLIAKASVSRAIVGPGRVRSRGDIRLHLHTTLMRIRSDHAFPMREHIPFSLGNALPVSRPPAQENQSGSANAEHDPKWTVGLSPAACFVFGLARGSTSPPREPVGAEGARRALTGDEAGTRAPPSLRGPPSGGSARFRVPEIRIE